MMKVFHVTHKKFLTAKDHIDYHPSEIQNNTTRTKRSVLYDMYGQYITSSKILTPSEDSFLNAYMKDLYKINPSLHNKLLDESGTAENKEELLFSHDKLLLASILRPLHQVTEEILV